MKIRSFILVFTLLTTLLLFSGCLQGSGTLITESRSVSDFDDIELDGSGALIVIQGEEEALTVETDDNIMPHVTTEVRGRTLRLSLDSLRYSMISPTRLEYRLVVKELKGLGIAGSGSVEGDSLSADRLALGISGSGTARLSGLQVDELELGVSGSGEVELTGLAARQRINIAGSGSVQAGELRGDVVEITISGSGEATVWAREVLDARISGSGSVNYYGSPAINTSLAGAGDINSLGQR